MASWVEKLARVVDMPTQSRGELSVLYEGVEGDGVRHSPHPMQRDQRKPPQLNEAKPHAPSVNE